MSIRLMRLLVGIPMIASVAVLAPASAEAPAPTVRATAACASSLPTPLDYLVLASLADSSSLLRMSAYRTPAKLGSP